MASDGPSKKHLAELLLGVLPARLKPSSAEKRTLVDFADLLAAKVAAGRSFSCLITNDRELLRLNATFLGNEYATDVLSFPTHAAGKGAADSNIGEIAISIERAQAQAFEFGHAWLDEIRILMLHGVLHLTGLDHERDNGQMARAERRWRVQFSLPQKTLIARSCAVHDTVKPEALAL